MCKARGMRQEVDSRDEVMHSEMSDWWRRGSPETARGRSATPVTIEDHGSLKLPKDTNELKISKLKCIYINARSIINKLDELQATVAALNPDIVGITESWAHKNILDGELSIPGFDLFRCDRTSRKGGGVSTTIRVCTF